MLEITKQPNVVYVGNHQTATSDCTVNTDLEDMTGNPEVVSLESKIVIKNGKIPCCEGNESPSKAKYSGVHSDDLSDLGSGSDFVGDVNSLIQQSTLLKEPSLIEQKCS